MRWPRPCGWTGSPDDAGSGQRLRERLAPDAHGIWWGRFEATTLGGSSPTCGPEEEQMNYRKRVVGFVLCVPLVASLLNAPPAHAAQHAVVVRMALTSVWSTPSPDPMGLTYDPRTRRLLISDSEVDEIPALWKGKNFFVARRKGALVAAR